MANEQNLRPSEHKFTQEEAKRGGINSGKKRRERKLMREAFEELLKRGYTNAQGQEMDGVSILCMKQFQNALDGDLKAFLAIRDAVGEMPVQRVEVDTIDPQAYERVERLLTED